MIFVKEFTATFKSMFEPVSLRFDFEVGFQSLSSFRFTVPVLDGRTDDGNPDNAENPACGKNAGDVDENRGNDGDEDDGEKDKDFEDRESDSENGGENSKDGDDGSEDGKDCSDERRDDSEDGKEDPTDCEDDW